jgi:hypothetical protein
MVYQARALIGQLPKEVEYDRSLPGGVPVDSRPEIHATTDADFRALKTMLGKLYLCKEHVAQYRTTGGQWRRKAGRMIT